MWINNASYVSVSNLEVSHAGAGIVAWYTTNLHDGLKFDNIYVHHITGVFAGSPAQTDLPGMYHSAGILVTGQVPETASDYAVQNVTFTNIEGTLNNDDIDIAKVAILFDWDNWWAIAMSSGPSIALQYVNEVHKYYEALYRAHIGVDVIGVDADLSGYDVVIAHVLYMVKPGVTEKLEAFVSRGGSLVRPSSAASLMRTIAL